MKPINMFNVEDLEIDEQDDILASETKKTRKQRRQSNKPKKTRPIATKGGKKKFKKGQKKTNRNKGGQGRRLTKFSSHLKRSLNNLDKHHIDMAYKYIEQENLHNLKVSISVLDVHQFCVSCSHCIRAINQCSYYHLNCRDFKPQSCMAKTRF